MDTIEAITTRRSVRKFTDDPIRPDDLRSMLEAAMQAPSAANEQPWEFVLITKREMLDKIPIFSPYAQMVKKAPLGILICADTRRLVIPGFWQQDCAAATQNILLAAHTLGYGAVWTGVFPLEDRVAGFSKLCHLPDKVVPFAFVVIGHPAQKVSPEKRYREDRVHHDLWTAHGH